MCDPVFPVARAVATAKTQNVEKLRDIMPLYYYHFSELFHLQNLYSGHRVHYNICNFLFPFYRSRILSRILWRWSFYRLYAASPLGMPLRIRVENSRRTHSAIRISWKNAGNIFAICVSGNDFSLRQIDVMQITELYQISVTKRDRFKDSSPSRLISMTIDVATRELP